MNKKIEDKIDEMIYEYFINYCEEANKNDLIRYIQKYNIDVNFDNGYYLELVAERNDIELFDVMIKYGGDITLNNYGVLRLIAHRGYLGFLGYLVGKYQINCNVLKDSSAYNNYNEIKKYIDNNID